MKNIKKMMAAVSLMAVLMVGSAFAGDGIIVTGFNQDNQPCTDQQQMGTKKGVILSDFTGIILSDFTGIIVTGFTGIIVTGAADTPVNCGIIVTG